MQIKANISSGTVNKLLNGDILTIECNDKYKQKATIRVKIIEIVTDRKKCPRCGVYLDSVESKTVSGQTMCIYCAERFLKKKSETSKIYWEKQKAKGIKPKNNFRIKRTSS